MNWRSLQDNRRGPKMMLYTNGLSCVPLTAYIPAMNYLTSYRLQGFRKTTRGDSESNQSYLTYAASV
jgi:hypothetical protein